MESTSLFRQLANLITVKEICSQLYPSIIDSSRTVAEVHDEWGGDFCYEHEVNPLDYIALVAEDGKIVGWIEFAMLEANKVISECMESISPDMILSADTTLFECIKAFSNSSRYFFVILRGNEYIGWLSWLDLQKPYVRVCIFSMLIHIEGQLLNVAFRNSNRTIQNLSPGRLEKAKHLYELRNYQYNEQGNPYANNLLMCTTFIDKFSVLRKIEKVVELVPSLENKRLCKKAEDIRNQIAHPIIEDYVMKGLSSKEDFCSFIEWLEQLEEELRKYLEENPGIILS